jgi:AcrR family transcriptional regulator
VLVAARRLFAKKGYDRTSVEDIGRTLHLSGPALYRHFKSKEEMFVATMADGAEAADEALRKADGLPALEALTVILTGEAHTAVEYRDCMLISQREQNRIPPRFRKVLAERRERLNVGIDRALDDLRPDLTVPQRVELRNVLMSIALGAPHMNSELPPDERIAFLVETGLKIVEK